MVVPRRALGNDAGLEGRSGSRRPARIWSTGLERQPLRQGREDAGGHKRKTVSAAAQHVRLGKHFNKYENSKMFDQREAYGLPKERMEAYCDQEHYTNRSELYRFIDTALQLQLYRLNEGLELGNQNHST
eukprot:8456871-Heterocapsa_arctica.AAC.1